MATTMAMPQGHVASKDSQSIISKSHLHATGGTPAAGYDALDIKVKAARDKLIADFVAKNPKSKVAHDEACSLLPGGNTRTTLFSAPFPLYFSRGYGTTLESVDGHPYLDFVSEYSAGIYGHSNPEILAALNDAMKNGVSLGGHTVYEAQLAKHIKERFKNLELLRFCNSGTEANMLALATACWYTGRKQIVVFSNGYHGSTLMFPSNLSSPSSPINLPHDFIIAPYDSISGTGPLITDSVAAILVEPVQGSGGAIPASREFLQFLRTEATRVGAILIMDEVMTSRLAWGGMQSVHGITPDLTTMGKYLGGGMGFGAFGGRQDIMKAFDPRTGVLVHGGTFNNNVLNMVAGVAGAKVLKKEVLDRMNELGDELRKKLEGVAKEMNGMTITGYGSMIGVHIGGGERSEILKECLFLWCLEQGLYIGRRGFLALNIEHTKEDVERVVIVIKGFLEEYHDYF